MVINYIRHNEIDFSKWNYCVENSINSLVYGMSWYLDITCENWDAIIIDDYKAVLPLPWKRKLGLKFIYHPFFSQQLGIFFQDARYSTVDAVLKFIPSAFVKYELSCNSMNIVHSKSKVKRINYILNTNNSYDVLKSSFSTNTKRNIKKSERSNLIVKGSIPVEDFLILKKQNNISRLSDDSFKVLHRLFDRLISTNNGKIIGAYNPFGELVGAAIFVEFKSRIIYLFSASTDEGKSEKAMFAIVNSVIEKNAEQNIVIDFEGSMISGVARFFKGFGAKIETYYRISDSKIPFIK